MANLSLTREFGRVLTITMPDVVPMIWDNISTRIPTIHWLEEGGRKELRDGGFALSRNIFKELFNAVGYVGATTIAPNIPDPMTRIEYAWKNIAVPFKVLGTDLIKNSGKNAIQDMMEVFIEMAEVSGAEFLGGSASGVHSSADETDETKVTGLANIVKPTGSNASGTTGKLSRSANSFWRNSVTASDITSFATNGLSRWREAYINCTRGSNETPDAVITTLAQYLNFLDAHTTDINFNLPMASGKGLFDSSVPDVFFMGAKVLRDDNATANEARFLNSRYLKFVVHSDRDFALREFVIPEDQDAISTVLLWSGNLVCTNLARQGIVVGGDTA